MTDKQIIIDGVDVSDCEYIACRESDNPICIIGDIHCKNYDTCYYKQLKRKEQECKNNEIANKNELEIYNQECFNLQQQLDAALDELDQLKAENEKLKNELSFMVLVEARKEEEKQSRVYFENLADRYKQALDEIEEIFMGVKTPLFGHIPDPQIRTGSVCAYVILDIINKAKDGE